MEPGIDKEQEQPAQEGVSGEWKGWALSSRVWGFDIPIDDGWPLNERVIHPLKLLFPALRG